MEEYLGEPYWRSSVVSNIYKSNVLASLTHRSNNHKSGRCLLYKESDLYQTLRKRPETKPHHSKLPKAARSRQNRKFPNRKTQKLVHEMKPTKPTGQYNV